jgi:hypothetical protein
VSRLARFARVFRARLDRRCAAGCAFARCLDRRLASAMAPLHTAAKTGNLDGVRRALSDGADVNGKDSVRRPAVAGV